MSPTDPTGEAPRPRDVADAPAGPEPLGADAPGSLVVSPPPAPDDASFWTRQDASTGIRVASHETPAWMASPEQFESMREVRTRLIHAASSSGREQFTTMVVPMTDGCGGSFVARNLAAAFTLQQRPSLLIECNFRREWEDDGFGPGPDAHGLFEFLSEFDGSSAVLPIWPTMIRGLNVIPIGRRGSRLPLAQREQLSSPSMRELMAKVRGWPCHVFLDAPPVEGSPDARILADLADYVVLVVGYGRSTARAVARAAAMFDRDKFAGAVFNEAPAARRA